jgi:hypothetical protein
MCLDPASLAVAAGSAALSAGGKFLSDKNAQSAAAREAAARNAVGAPTKALRPSVDGLSTCETHRLVARKMMGFASLPALRPLNAGAHGDDGAPRAAKE